MPLDNGEIDEATLLGLLDHPAVPALRTIRLSSNGLGASACEALGCHPKTAKVQRLVLADNPVQDGGLAAIAGSPMAKHLRELDVSGVQATASGIQRLLGSTPGLLRLVSGRQRLGDGVVRAIVALPELAFAQLDDAAIEPAGAGMLLESGLQSLGLSNNLLGVGGLGSRTSVGDRLVTLDLSTTGLGPVDAQALAAVRAPSLANLHLARCPIGDAGVLILAGSSLLHQLEQLDLAGVNVSGEARERMQEAWGERPGLSWGVEPA